MREIKFRGKSVDSGKWVYGWVFGDKAKSIIEIDKDYLNEYGVEAYYTSVVIPETVGQYTGVKDCKGKEIYEGDIIEFARSRHQVRFIDGSFALYDRNQWHIPFYTLHGGTKVVGNIYENPELI